MFLDRRARERERSIASSALGWNQMVGGRVRDAGSQVNNKWVAAAQSRQGECLRPWWGTPVPSILPPDPGPRAPAAQNQPRDSVGELLYAGENSPRISDTGRIVRRLENHRSDKACASEESGDDDVDKEGNAAKNIGQRRPPLHDVTGSTIKVTLRCTRMTCSTSA